MKKGGSHIGVVISFVLFVTFVVFTIIIIQPSFKSQESKAYLLEQIRTNLFEDWIYESNIGSKIEEHKDSYNELKEELNIPPQDNFAFNFTNSDEEIIGTEWNIPRLANAYIREYPLVYLDTDSKLQVGILTIGVW